MRFATGFGQAYETIFVNDGSTDATEQTARCSDAGLARGAADRIAQTTMGRPPRCSLA